MTATRDITITFFGAETGPQGRAVVARVGHSLMKAAVAADIEGVAADCGGTLTCATCHVMVREPWLALLPAMTDDEDGMLDYAAAPRVPASRLSCQIVLDASLDGMQVDLPSTQY